MGEVNDIRGMFYGCTDVKEIRLGNIRNIKNTYGVVDMCSNLASIEIRGKQYNCVELSVVDIEEIMRTGGKVWID